MTYDEIGGGGALPERGEPFADSGAIGREDRVVQQVELPSADIAGPASEINTTTPARFAAEAGERTYSCAARNAWASCSTRASLLGRPSICRPTGRPSTSPAGTEIAGQPSRLATPVMAV